MTSVQDVLSNIGYELRDCGKFYRAKPLYRESNNNTSLSVDKETGNWKDFSTQQYGSLRQLVKITLGISSEEDLTKYFNGFTPSTVRKTVEIEQQKTFSKDLLIKLRKDYSYWNARGVSNEILELLQGGVADNGKMANRFVFPIFNEKDEIVGFSGRDLTGFSPIKWKTISSKSNWCYPLKINKEIIIKSKQVVILESAGDFLNLWEAGVKNGLVVFGVELSPQFISNLIRLDVNQIILALNNDFGNNDVGNKAAEKAKEKLLNYFDEGQIKIALPEKKDFGEMSHEEIIKWKNNL